MIKVIQEETISFGSRLKQLMDEKKVSNGTVANYVGVSKTAVSDWRTGKHPLTRFKDETLEKLAKEFDVDVEYLKCTQIERRKDQAPSASRKRAAKARLKNQMKRISPEELQRAEESIKRYKLLQNAIRILNDIGIEIYPAGDDHQQDYEYQIIQDSTIYTIQQSDDISSGSDFIVISPDGSQSSRSADQIISLYDSMKSFCINQLQSDPEE